MEQQAQPLGVEEATRAQARTEIYERLALISALIWMGGTAILFLTYVPFVAHPYSYFTVAVIVPLFPAALPWALYRRLSARRTRQLLALHKPQD